MIRFPLSLFAFGRLFGGSRSGITRRAGGSFPPFRLGFLRYDGGGELHRHGVGKREGSGRIRKGEFDDGSGEFRSGDGVESLRRHSFTSRDAWGSYGAGLSELVLCFDSRGESDEGLTQRYGSLHFVLGGRARVR